VGAIVSKKSWLQGVKRSRSGGAASIYGEHLQRGRRGFLGVTRRAWRSHVAPHRDFEQVLSTPPVVKAREPLQNLLRKAGAMVFAGLQDANRSRSGATARICNAANHKNP